MKVPNEEVDLEDAESLLLFGCQVDLSNTEWGADGSTVHTTESLVALLETGDKKMYDLIEMSHQLQDIILDLRQLGCREETITLLAEAYEKLVDQIDEEGLEDV